MPNRWILCGLGRLGSAMFKAKIDNGFRWDIVCPSATKTDSVSEKIGNNQAVDIVSWSTLPEIISTGDIIVLAVPDSNINWMVESLDKEGVTIIHCSGATPLPTLQKASAGVCYPLQTFSDSAVLNWAEIPFFIESSEHQVITYLEDLIQRLGGLKINAEYADSHKRLQIHAAAVFGNNFAQASVAIAEQLLKESNIQFNVLMPILKQMSNQWGLESPVSGITGPAVRRDWVTIEKHQELLRNHPNWQELYRVFTKVIQELKS